jgi:hypothetical protein
VNDGNAERGYGQDEHHAHGKEPEQEVICFHSGMLLLYVLHEGGWRDADVPIAPVCLEAIQAGRVRFWFARPSLGAGTAGVLD